jgi:catechol 2,3-dioxygenase-like lactoylglutathione lyase family enzyme
VDACIDHMILPINEPLADSLAFYCDLLGFARDGVEGPFECVRVSPSFVLLLSPYGTRGGIHLAFNLEARRFDEVFGEIRARKLAYGDRFDQTSNLQGPTPQAGATGDVPAIYLLDPSKHLIELRRAA